MAAARECARLVAVATRARPRPEDRFRPLFAGRVAARSTTRPGDLRPRFGSKNRFRTQALLPAPVRLPKFAHEEAGRRFRPDGCRWSTAVADRSRLLQ